MKTLKLDHDLATQIREGKKRTTWRLYDDKDISVGDKVLLIDKKDGDKPETWESMGVAHVTQVTEKRIRDLNTDDREGHEKYNSKDELLTTFKRYYGDRVTLDTPIKVIKFTYTHKKSDVSHSDAQKSTKYKKLALYADGGSRGNPGPSASGFALVGDDDKVVVKKSMYLGVTTNNQAEYQSLKFGLEEAQKLHVPEVHVYMDSQLVVKQMQGVYKVKNRDLWPIYSSVKDLVATFKRVTFTHVPRELNKIADAAVNEALDEALQNQS